MEIVTIACPPNFTDPNVADNAPIWLDANGVEYMAASGLLEGYEPTEAVLAAPDRVTVVVGMDGLDALSAMGLTVKEVEP